MRPPVRSGENWTVVKQWRRWLPGRKHGVARGVAGVRKSRLYPDIDGLNELLGRWPALRSWAECHGLTLSGVAADLQLLDQEISEQFHEL